MLVTAAKGLGGNESNTARKPSAFSGMHMGTGEE